MKIKETGCTANQFSAKQPTVKQQIKSLKDITDKSCQEKEICTIITCTKRNKLKSTVLSKNCYIKKNNTLKNETTLLR